MRDSTTYAMKRPCDECEHYPCFHTGCDCDGTFHTPGPDCPGQQGAIPCAEEIREKAWVTAANAEFRAGIGDRAKAREYRGIVNVFAWVLGEDWAA